jgi:exodeoxyribonuclease VII small subunit
MSQANTEAALPARYEDALSELEQLVQKMEQGVLPLDQLLVGYERSAQLLGFCRAALNKVEQQVQTLENGQLKALNHL